MQVDWNLMWLPQRPKSCIRIRYKKSFRMLILIQEYALELPLSLSRTVISPTVMIHNVLNISRPPPHVLKGFSNFGIFQGFSGFGLVSDTLWSSRITTWARDHTSQSHWLVICDTHFMYEAITAMWDDFKYNFERFFGLDVFTFHPDTPYNLQKALWRENMQRK